MWQTFCQTSSRFINRPILSQICRQSQISSSHSKLPSISCQNYRNFASEIPRKSRKEAFLNITWKSVGVASIFGGIALYWLWNLKKKQEEELEKRRRRSVGQFMIGGPWQMKDMNGKECSNEEYLGKWVLIYFGFTHCPDICPDELEKMCKVAQKLRDDSKEEIATLFFSVDPERDSPKVVKEYCADFAKDLIGFTGTKQQVDKVCKTFRVYHTSGPRDKDDDYIVDHTIMMYLIDPEGTFVDYYGQYRTFEDIADGIHLHMFKYKKGKDLGWW